MAFLMQWATTSPNPVGHSKMRTVIEMEKEGWEWVSMHPFYRDSVLMKKEIIELKKEEEMIIISPTSESPISKP